MIKRNAMMVHFAVMAMLAMAAESSESKEGDVSLDVGQTLYFDLTSIVRGEATTALRRFTEPPPSLNDVVMARLVKVADGTAALEVRNGFAPGLYYEVQACTTSDDTSCRDVGNSTSRVGHLEIRNLGTNVNRVILSGFRVMRIAVSSRPPPSPPN
jgi:hypothetical protein